MISGPVSHTSPLQRVDDAITSGIHAYVVTPVDQNGSFMGDSHAEVVNRVITAGCEGITILGATGELPYVSRSVRNALIAATVEVVGDRAAVITGVGGFTAPEIIQQAQAAEDLGTDGVLVMLQGFLRLSSSEQVKLFTDVAERVKVPITVYVNPPLCNVSYTLDTLLEIADIPAVVAIKDATGTLQSFESAALFAETGTRLFAATATPLTAAFLLGASGWMSGTATVFPQQCHDFYEACRQKDWEKAASIERRLSSALGAFRAAGPAIVKALLNAKGFNVGDPLGPSIPIPQPQASALLRSVEQTLNRKEV